jgi:hypothetical protein
MINSTITKSDRPVAPFVATVFDPNGRIVASHGFPTQADAEAFLQAFAQEGAGEYGLAPASTQPPRASSS